jgi:hypothetical protein
LTRAVKSFITLGPDQISGKFTSLRKSENTRKKKLLLQTRSKNTCRPGMVPFVIFAFGVEHN